MGPDSALTDLYRAAILDHNRNPRHKHALADATHQSRGLNALCGDDIQVYIKVGVGQRIEAVGFTGHASAITMASASMMSEHLPGLTIECALTRFQGLKALLSAHGPSAAQREAMGILAALEGVKAYPSRIKSALLPWQTFLAALSDQAVASTE